MSCLYIKHEEKKMLSEKAFLKFSHLLDIFCDKWLPWLRLNNLIKTKFSNVSVTQLLCFVLYRDNVPSRNCSIVWNDRKKVALITLARCQVIFWQKRKENEYFEVWRKQDGVSWRSQCSRHSSVFGVLGVLVALSIVGTVCVLSALNIFWI
jgi:hypothetical protein